MTNKYQIIFRKKYSQQFSAQEKAPRDVMNILDKLGYRIIEIPIKEDSNAILRMLYLMINLFIEFNKINSHSELFFQYPFTKYVNYWFWFLKIKKIKLKVLIHDIESLRYVGTISNEEVVCLSHFDEIIVHTDSMKNLLVCNGINESKIKTLYLFDYLVDKSLSNISQTFGYTICFAGNLDKSLFLSKLKSIASPNMKYVLYGSMPSSNIFTDNIIYSGKFSPDDISILNADWGLVWDGNSVDTCEGQLGEYLKYNSSHKLSLYLAKGIPVIVWSQSAVASFVSDNNLGIIVNSLMEINSKIESLGNSGYLEMMKEIKYFSEKIRSGEMLKSIICK